MRRLILLLLLAASASAATLVSKVTGNFTASGTWGVGEAGASAIQTTRSASTNSTTSYVYSSAWTCTNLDVLDGVLVYGSRLNTTGTVSIAISDDNGTTATREVTVNAADLDDDDSTHFFKLGSTLTCDGGADYKVGFKGSSAANSRLYRDGTAGNWFRVPRVTAEAAPGAADLLYVNGELTGQGTGNSFVVTMNNTAATTFGTVAATSSVGVGVRGTMTWGTAAATAYLLKVAGLVNIFGGGTWNQGTSGTPVPSGSTATLSFDLTGNVDSGLVVENGGTFVAQGATKTTVSTLLNTDEAAASTVIGVASTAGWAVSDVIGIASTTRTFSQYESLTVLTVDSATQFTSTAGLVNAHSGTSPTQAEAINLTRNVVITGESATLQGYVNVKATASFTAAYTEFTFLGSNTAAKRGIDTATTSGTFSLSFCSLHDFRVAGSIGIQQNAAISGTFIVDNTVFYRILNLFINFGSAHSGGSFTNNTMVGTDAGSGANGCALINGGPGFTFTGNTLTSCNDSGLLFTPIATVPTSFSTFTSHSHSSIGLRINPTTVVPDLIMSNLTIWRNTLYGIQFESTGYLVRNTITTVVLFGNTTNNIFLRDSIILIDNIWDGWTVSGDTTFATAGGLSYNAGQGNSVVNHRIRNSTFGVVSGIKTAHTAQDYAVPGSTVQEFLFENCSLASATPISTPSNLIGTGYLAHQKWAQTAASHRTYFQYGTVQYDATTVRAALPSQRVTPNNASNKIASGPWKVGAASGATVIASVWVRKSTVADSCGANYNGNELRLVLEANPAAGIAANVVGDTSTVAVGNWENLTFTTAAVTDDAALKFYVDGDGTAGCFYVESGLTWFAGLPTEVGAGGGGSGVGGAGAADTYIARRF